MTDKGPSISWADFQSLLPNGSPVRAVSGRVPEGLTLPIEGILLIPDVDEISPDVNVKGVNTLRMQSPARVEIVRFQAEHGEYNVNGTWLSFRDLCNHVTGHRLAEARSVADTHPLAWMTHPAELNMSINQIGAMVYDVATWIEQSGNRGYSDTALQIGVPTLRIKLLNIPYIAAWKDIVFYGEGESKHDFRGWGVHKRTPAHWSATWLERYGLDSEIGQAHMARMWDEAHAEHAKRAVKRPSETYAGIDLEKEPTQEIAHRAAALWLLGQWAQQRRWQHWEAREIWGLQAHLYNEGSKVFQHELRYRADQQPKPRRGKKKTQAVRDDWATACDYFNGWHFKAERFYTLAYLKVCCNSDAVPDTSVDFEALPRDIQAGAITITQDEEIQP